MFSVGSASHQFEPGNLRHKDVDYRKVERASINGFRGQRDCHCPFHFRRKIDFHEVGDKVANLRIVIDHQNLCHGSPPVQPSVLQGTLLLTWSLL
jgi:hypothetical protein